MPSRRALASLVAILLAAGLTLVPQAGSSGGAAAAPLQQVAPFLFPPFPSSATEESIFDHTSPNYSQSDNRIVTYGGHEARKYCPSPAPEGTPPPLPSVCDAGYGIFWSYDL